MRDIYLGDSYDLVKRFWHSVLTDVAPIYAHARFIPVDLRERFSRLTKILVLDESNLPSRPFAVLLDPHTGIPLLDSAQTQASIALAPLVFIASVFDRLNPEFVICFDQSHDRQRSKQGVKLDEQRELKRDELILKGIYSFYYVSHAPFLFMAKDTSVLDRIRRILIDSGLPEATHSTIRLQPIRTSRPEQDGGGNSASLRSSP